MNNAVALQQQRDLGISHLAADLQRLRALAGDGERRRRTLPPFLRGPVAHLGASPNLNLAAVNIEAVSIATAQFIGHTRQATEQMQAILLSVAICCRHASGIDPKTREQLLSLIDRANDAIGQ